MTFCDKTFVSVRTISTAPPKASVTHEPRSTYETDFSKAFKNMTWHTGGFGEVHGVLCRVIGTAKKRKYTAVYEKHVGFNAQIDAAMQIERVEK